MPTTMRLANGPGGVATKDRFTTGPGYQFQVDEATKNALTAASRTGPSAVAVPRRLSPIAPGPRQWRVWFVPRSTGGLRQSAAAGHAVATASLVRTRLWPTSMRRATADFRRPGSNAVARAGLREWLRPDISNVLGNVAAGRTQTLGHHGGQRGVQPSHKRRLVKRHPICGASVPGSGRRQRFAPARA
jgi:hypothetical protein